ncbi:MAG: chemotaxis protein CheB [Lautropia sp.]
MSAPARPPEGRAPGPARVLVIDASDDARRALIESIDAQAALRVVADAGTGGQALDLLTRTRADVVFVNGPLPGMDAFETTRRIMESSPVPIVLGTVADPNDDLAFRSLEAGAVACVADPIRSPPPRPGSARRSNWLQTLQAMAEVKVVRRRPLETAPASPRGYGRIRMIGIGASTGGPVVLQQILAALPQAFPVPILVVQHIARGFLPGMAEWLRQTVGLRVQIAAHGIVPAAGHVYLAPDDFQLGLSAGGALRLTRPDTDPGPRPSVAHLFRSLAEHLGPAAVGVLLTGMGRDGAAELRLMRERGAATIAQDRATSVVHGMPGEAIALGAASRVLPGDRIAPVLVDLVQPAMAGFDGDATEP